MTAAIIRPGVLTQTGCGLRDRVQLVFPEAYFQFAWMPPKLTPANWVRLTQRTPFVGLGWNGLSPKQPGALRFHGLSHWSLFLVVKNQASAQARYVGDAQGIGLFDMVQAAIAALNGYTVPGIGTAMIAGSASAYAEGWDNDETIMAALDIQVGAEVSIPATLQHGEAEPAAFKTMADSWAWLGAAQLTDINPVQGAS